MTDNNEMIVGYVLAMLAVNLFPIIYYKYFHKKRAIEDE